ncbi:MAG: Uma2 family endonuclease [Myxococcaceae bacterium]|nr:Uma2 family endonuclease [Myxococcaceae bacterium]
MNAQPKEKMTYAEYLAREAASDVKHEFIAGEVFAMAGGTVEHGALAVAFGAELRNALSGKPCRVLNSDVRVQVRSTGAAFYPDVSVVCGKLETAADDPHAVTNPVVLVDVLSASTEGDDRGAKAAHYRRLDSLREYVLVSQGERRVEVQRRNERGIWELHFSGPGERVELTSLGVSLAVDAVYANPLA